MTPEEKDITALIAPFRGWQLPGVRCVDPENGELWRCVQASGCDGDDIVTRYRVLCTVPDDRTER